jgi:hypothetical protein
MTKHAGMGLIFLAALLLGLAGCTPPGPRALLKGRELLEKGDYVHALAELKTATTLLPTNAHAWNYLGLAYHHAGQPDEAQKAYQRALPAGQRPSSRRVLTSDASGWSRTSSSGPRRSGRLHDAPAAVGGRICEAGHGAMAPARSRRRREKLSGGLAAPAQRFPRQSPAWAWCGSRRGRVARHRNCLPKHSGGTRPRAARLNLAVIAHEHLKDKALALQHYRRLCQPAAAPRQPRSHQSHHQPPRARDGSFVPAPRRQSNPGGSPLPRRPSRQPRRAAQWWPLPKPPPLPRPRTQQRQQRPNLRPTQPADEPHPRPNRALLQPNRRWRLPLRLPSSKRR